jgi:hypothetical protein
MQKSDNMNKPDKRTLWARRARPVYNEFTGTRITGEQLASLKRLAGLLNVDVSDVLRVLIVAVGGLADISGVFATRTPPATSDKIHYV